MSAAVERYEIPLSEVRLTDAERVKLSYTHQRIDVEWREVWDDAAQAVVERAIPLPEPICAACREPWGKYGCATSRAVALVGIYEREHAKDRRRIEELTEALTPRFGVHHLRRSQNQRVELRMYVDEYTLMYGGLGVIDGVLRKMRDEWQRWFRHTGEKKRIASDALYATTVNASYYEWLTQDFDPTASALKRPDAPWDDPDWVAATKALSRPPLPTGGEE